ncbi:aldehyde dehydrogenase family protein [Marinobacterium sp. D7]|uniref:aldehyde dehydrogenase family protein n=1 Tax=Marinobacterium ramblicola TaxID=2849041 RepID=UPI001C2DB26E|nr:aldehyde dehydrogenase family protein [Marinobacterium ramblicola]MBV1788248.1 aldehyde dehydrogenase family protein [Marinobacterium ramblicola]
MKTSYINGRFIEAGEQELKNINPSDISDVIDTFSRAGRAETRQAITAAAAAADSWGRSNPQQRFDILDFIGSEILARREELGALLSREEGKTLPEGIGEVTRAGYLFKFFAGEALRIGGEKLDSVRAGATIDITREPVGVVGIITPWNFPVAIPAWKIAPALCYGNAVVFKPAELVPSSAWALAEIISRSGLPAGVFNMVIGPGREVGDEIIGSNEVQAITFTGSVSTGTMIAQRCAARMAKVQLELGGKNPLIVLDDADLEQAVDVAVQGSFYSTGQRCTASSRIIVTDGIYNDFIALLAKRTKALRVGNALSSDTQIGPVASASQLQQDLEYIEIAKQEGATLLVGGKRIEGETEGYYLQPAIFTDVDNRMRICREEVFGPVATVSRVADYEAALAEANDTQFGLSAGICTTSLKYAEHYKRHAKAGMVMVNLPTAGVDYHVPFGGTKASSYGPREQGRYAAEFYTRVKTAYQKAD